ncbi:hypothetical protein [Mangrovimonas aestuarii]|uniref:hypothetical protein n=1 Tax=Mangrovimonas aestuarii TaxID=3018443 RepID=UPI00237914BE|nr:hypothetical protein [Mangrovimonas aestuarii]
MQYNKCKYKAYTQKNWMMLFWILNPGTAINEVVLGQRLPKISLVDKTSIKPLAERSYVPCPHCNTLHDGRTWSTQNGTAFKNWFGLYCHECGGVIPCMTSLTSYIVLGLTYPFWGWFKVSLKDKWLAKQPERFNEIDITTIPNPYEGKGWIKVGLSWGLFMYVFMTFLFPLFQEQPITWKSVLISIPLWAISGLGFGYFMKRYTGKLGGKKAVNNT